jgi:DinB superfamily
MKTDIFASAFSREYERYRAHVHELAAPLSDDAFWTKPFGFGNSFGHLVLHLTGNLNYYIGARVADTGYMRTRDREFTETERRPKAEILRDFDAAVDMVLRAIAAQRDEDWAAAYSGTGEPDAHNRFDIFLKCAMHFYHHVGQMVYLQKAVGPGPGGPQPPRV